MFTILGADGKEYGPASVDKVNEWITGGRANLQTKARRSAETEWKTLGDFPEFNAPPVAAAEPPAATPVAAAAAAASGGLVPAGRWERLGAQLIDGLIGCAVAAPGFAIMLMAGAFTHPENPNSPLMLGGIGVLGLMVLALAIYQVYLLSTRGQSLGKKFLNIRIVTHDGETNPGFVKVFLLRVLVNGLIGAVPFLGSLYSIVDVCFIFRDDRRCIHDFIAGTKVVQA